MVTLVTLALNQYDHLAAIKPFLSSSTVGAWRHYVTVAMTCELGMHTHYTILPNFTAFPACHVVMSEMDAEAGRQRGDTAYRCSIITSSRIFPLSLGV
jgi:hypothetical protein